MGSTNAPKTIGQSASLNRDLDNIIDLFTSSTITTVVTIPFLLVYFLVISLIGGAVALVPVALSIFLVVIHILNYLKTRHIALEQKNASIDKTGVFLETLTNLKLLNPLGPIIILKKNGIKSVAPHKTLVVK